MAIAGMLLALTLGAGAAEPLRTRAPGTLRVGTYFVNPPFEYVAKGARGLRGRSHGGDRTTA